MQALRPNPLIPLLVLAMSGCISPHTIRVAGHHQPSAVHQDHSSHQRTASYVIRGHQLEEKSGNDGERAMLILKDEHPSPVAHLHFWSGKAFDPKEKHWNRQVDLERCPVCHPQYDLHFSIQNLEPILQHLRQSNATVRLTCREDDWVIESPGSRLAPVRQTR